MFVSRVGNEFVGELRDVLPAAFRQYGFDIFKHSVADQITARSVLNPASLVQIVRSSAMPLRPWVEFKKGDLATNNRWFYRCQKRNIPHVTLETRVKYVTLSWDSISRDPKYDTHLGEDQGAILVRRMFATFQLRARHSPGRSMFEGSSFVGSVTNLVPDIARNLADEFFLMLVAPVDQAIAA